MLQKQTAINLHKFINEVKKRMEETKSTTIKIRATDFCDVLNLRTCQYYINLGMDIGLLKKAGPSLYEVNPNYDQKWSNKCIEYYFADITVRFINDANEVPLISLDSISEVIKRKTEDIVAVLKKDTIGIQYQMFGTHYFIPLSDFESCLLTLALNTTFSRKEKETIKRFRYWVSQVDGLVKNTTPKELPPMQSTPQASKKPATKKAAHKTKPSKDRTLKKELEQEKKKKKEFIENITKALKEYAR